MLVKFLWSVGLEVEESLKIWGHQSLTRHTLARTWSKEAVRGGSGGGQPGKQAAVSPHPALAQSGGWEVGVVGGSPARNCLSVQVTLSENTRYSKG